jgi:hypothetical protein
METMVKAPSSDPYPLGESPFRIKGLGYRGHVEHTNQYVRGGLARALQTANDPALDKFFAQPFLAASWYDIFPLVKIGTVCAALVGVPYREYLVERTRKQAQADLSSVYHQLLLWIAQPGSVARRIPGMVSRYFNFAPAQVVEEGEGYTRGVSDRFPAPLLTWYEPVVTTWLTEALRMAGAQEPRIELSTRPCAVTHEGGIELLELHWRLSWDAR